MYYINIIQRDKTGLCSLSIMARTEVFQILKIFWFGNIFNETSYGLNSSLNMKLIKFHVSYIYILKLIFYRVFYNFLVQSDVEFPLWCHWKIKRFQSLDHFRFQIRNNQPVQTCYFPGIFPCWYHHHVNDQHDRF